MDDWEQMDSRLRLPLAGVTAAEVPSCAGVYALYRDDDRRILLGSAPCLRDRIWGTPADGADASERVAALRLRFGGCAIAWLECESEEEAQRLESELKSAFSPPGDRS